jgi:hypothetical protein
MVDDVDQGDSARREGIKSECTAVKEFGSGDYSTSS